MAASAQKSKGVVYEGGSVRKTAAFAGTVFIFGLVFSACGNYVDEARSFLDLPPLIGEASVVGTAQVWRELTAVFSSELDIDEDGFYFMWMRLDGTTLSRIGTNQKTFSILPGSLDGACYVAVIVSHDDYSNAIISGQIEVVQSEEAYEEYILIHREDFSATGPVNVSLSDFLDDEGEFPVGIRLAEPWQYEPESIRWFRGSYELTDIAFGDYGEALPFYGVVLINGMFHDIRVRVGIGGSVSDVLIRIR